MSEIISFLNTATTIVLITIGLTYILFKKWLLDRVGLITEKDFTIFKSHVQTEHSKDLERLKNQLQLGAKHREIQFTKLREKQVEVFEKFYEKLSLTYYSVLTTVHIVELTEFKGRLDNSRDYFKDFELFYKAKKIFLTEKICTNTDILFAEMGKAVRARQSFDNESIPFQTRDAEWMKGYESVVTVCKTLMNDVENEFRKLLGVNES